MSPFQPTIIHFDSLPSTNTEAARHAQQGADEGLTIVAAEQTAGRGRLERSWISPAGAGLYTSIVLRPRLNPSVWSLIPLMAALAVHDALNESCGIAADIKWPNDILFAERKLCGILAETIETSAGRAAIVGVGINLTSQSFPEELKESATSVEAAAGKVVSIGEVLPSLLRALGNRYAQLQDDQSQIVTDWLAHSTYGHNKRVSVTSGYEQFSGTTRGLESDGALRVETESGEIRIVRAGDVFSLRGKECREP
ncbi:MAG TPA: biotin--[acetyl-CoA-carboxylase] ligase [Pyrinomonadaceae bacterium]|nr:biotin--[acetyl-CoA-carboxylase] ligase [Pyrinomonadaceae bacterium]